MSFEFEGLRDAMKNKAVQLYEDDVCVAIFDKYPKSMHHWLILPQEEIDTITDLNKSHIPLIKHMDNVGRQLIAQRGLSNVHFRLGFHAVPSMIQLHLHVISQDFCGPSLRSIRDYNSFATEYFIETQTLIQDLEENGEFTKFNMTTALALLGFKLKCNKCNEEFDAIGDLKIHLQGHMTS